MDKWLEFLATTTKLKRKNKKITFIKRQKEVRWNTDEIKIPVALSQKKVDAFSSREIERFEIDRTLDLHGLTELQAVERLKIFISAALDDGKRNLLIITGGSAKDSKVLRKMFIRFVHEEFSHAISRITCQPNNTGAFFIKLRKHIE